MERIDEVAPSDLDAIEKKTLEIGRYLFDSLDEKRPNIFQRRWWDDRVMAFAMKDEQLKVQLFRFVDVLPMLKTTDGVINHLDDYLGEVRDRLPMAARVALGVAKRTPLTRAAVARAARLTAMDFARRFIAGSNAEEVLKAAGRERKQKRGFTLDILGEAVTSDVEADRFFQSYIELIASVAPTVNSWPEVPQIDQGVSGPLPRVNLSIKLSALDAQFDPIDPSGVTDRAGSRLRELLRVARHHQAFINVDMESYDKKDLTLHVFQDVLMDDEFREIGDVGIVIQCYLRDAERDLVQLRDWAVKRGKPVWVRLVKGAYWDYETVHAQAEGWPIPVFQQKWESDVNFERMTRFVIKNWRHLRPALGSHNLRSLAHGIAAAEHVGLPDGGLEVQMLYGMADAEKRAIVERGHRMRTYMPYGELIPGMAYLVRRLLENTSNDSFLRAGFMEEISPDELLKNPTVGRTLLSVKECVEERVGQECPTYGSSNMADAPDTSKRTAENSLQANYQNHPQIDFAEADQRQAMADALAGVQQRLGASFPLVIGGETFQRSDKLDSIDPARTDRVVGTVSLASRQDVDAAVAAAKAALPAWQSLGATARAEFLRRAADMMRKRLFELSAWIVYECAKPWREATADVCEAIDFCEFYALGAIKMDSEAGADVPGEENRFVYLLGNGKHGRHEAG